MFLKFWNCFKNKKEKFIFKKKYLTFLVQSVHCKKTSWSYRTPTENAYKGTIAKYVYRRDSLVNFITIATGMCRSEMNYKRSI